MLRTTRIALLTATLSWSASMTALAQDQETGEVVLEPTQRPAVAAAPKTALNRPGPLRFYGGFNVAVGGELQRDPERGETTSRNLDPTAGLHGGVEFVAMKFFSIGGETRFLWFKPDQQAGHDFLWDIIVKPKGIYQLPNLPLEIYGALPFGMTVAALEGTNREGKVGFNIGLVGGATYFFTENMGANLEVGWNFHKFGAEENNDDYDAKMNQFLLLCPSFVYAL